MLYLTQKMYGEGTLCVYQRKLYVFITPLSEICNFDLLITVLINPLSYILNEYHTLHIVHMHNSIVA